MLSVNEQSGAITTAVILNGAGCGPAVNGHRDPEDLDSSHLTSSDRTPKPKPKRSGKSFKGIWISLQILNLGLLPGEEKLLGLIDGLTNEDTPCFASTEFLAGRIKRSERSTRRLLASLEKRGFIIRIRKKIVVAKALGRDPDVIQKWITDETMVEAEIDDEIDRQNGHRWPQNGHRRPRSILEESKEEKKEERASAHANQEVGSHSFSFLARSSEEAIAPTTATTDALTRNQSEERHCQPEAERTQDVLAKNPSTHIPGPHCGALARNGSDQARSAGELDATIPDAVARSAPGRVLSASATHHSERNGKRRSGQPRKRLPTLDEVIAHLTFRRFPASDAEDLHRQWRAGGKRWDDWRAQVDRYIAKGWLESQKEKKAQDESLMAEQERQRWEEANKNDRLRRREEARQKEEAVQRDYEATRENGEALQDWRKRSFRETLRKTGITTVRQEQQNKTMPRKPLAQVEKELADQRAEWLRTGVWPTTNDEQ